MKFSIHTQKDIIWYITDAHNISIFQNVLESFERTDSEVSKCYLFPAVGMTIKSL